MKSRRGLSTVVGAVFFVIAATTVITYISYSMNSIDEFAQSVIVSESQNINRGMEEISIPQATIVGGEFNATVINTGSLPVQLTRLWVIDEDSGLNSKADLTDVIINPGNQKYNIGQGTGISADSTTSYTLKAVTSRGNIATFAVSPDVSTQIQLIIPAEVAPEEEFRVVSIITNNSTLPNNIADLTPTITNNATLTQLEAIAPPSVAVLPQGNSVTFTSSWLAPEDVTNVRFNASYANAPEGTWTTSNMTVALTGESEEATNSQWSQAASRVGILISGLPNPAEATNGGVSYFGKWGIGIINPLNRDVEIYSVSLLAPVFDFFEGEPIGQEPDNASQWRKADLGVQSMMIWEAGNTPVIIPAEEVGQFRLETDFTAGGNDPIEGTVIIQALTSEGKLSTLYSISAYKEHPTINVYYTNDTSDPTNNWGYLIKDLKSGTTTQIFNATVENSADNTLTSEVKLIILVPSDFKNVASYGSNTGWDDTVIVQNPDGSSVINVNTTATTFPAEDYLNYQFSADVPEVTNTKLYVLQTTAIYPQWSNLAFKQVQIASALSEAGVEVDP